MKSRIVLVAGAIVIAGGAAFWVWRASFFDSQRPATPVQSIGSDGSGALKDTDTPNGAGATAPIALTTPTLASTVLPRSTEDDDARTTALVFRVEWGDDRQPTQGITCSVWPKDREEDEGCRKALTNAAGEAVVRFPKEWAEVRAAAYHDHTTREERDIALPAPQPVVFRLDRGYIVYGTVYAREEGSAPVPAPGAWVAIGSGFPWTRSNIDGTYELKWIPRSKIGLQAQLGRLRSGVQDEGVLRTDTLVYMQRNGPYDLTMGPAVTVTGLLPSAVLRPSKRSQTSGWPDLNIARRRAAP